MKLKRLFLLVLAFTLIGSASVWADEAIKYRNKVNVIVNGKALSAPGVLLEIDGVAKTMLPTRDIADILQAMVVWDDETKTVNIYKPNVHITLTTQNKDGSYGTFGSVYYQSNIDFYIFTQIDSLRTKIQNLKFEVLDPYGDIVFESEHELDSADEELWFRTPVSMKFQYLGKYKVRVYMKPEGQQQYSLVSEKVFESKQK